MEIWKDISGYEGLYQISNLGNVKSLERKVKGGHGNISLKKEKLLKFKIDKGYSRITLYKNNKYKLIQVHRLVANAFIENIENKKCVNHKNGIRNDNRVENLEWVTHSENTLHMYHTLGYKGNNFGKFGKYSNRHKQIKQYDLKNNFIKLWESIADVKRILKIDDGGIVKVCKGKRKTAGGYIWKYA